jgi:hypothetical protein
MPPLTLAHLPTLEVVYSSSFRNSSLRRWLIDTHVMGPGGMGNENVTGFYFDDDWAGVSGWLDGPSKTSPPKPFNQSDCGTGPSEIESHCLLDMGMTESERDAIVQGYKQTMAEVFEAVWVGLAAVLRRLRPQPAVRRALPARLRSRLRQLPPDQPQPLRPQSHRGY